MSGQSCIFYVDERGDVIGGQAGESITVTTQSWRMPSFPSRSPEADGFEIAWPDGVPFEYAHTTGQDDSSHPEVTTP